MNNDLVRRAAQALHNTETRVGAIHKQPSGESSGVEEHRGRTYVVLRNAHDVLAVYQANNAGTALRHLEVADWPDSVAAEAYRLSQARALIG
jgi:hypothetical protein